MKVSRSRKTRKSLPSLRRFTRSVFYFQRMAGYTAQFYNSLADAAQHIPQGRMTATLLVIFFSATTVADNRELELKVAYIANIAKFVSWEIPTRNISLCLSEHSDIAPIAMALNGYDIGKDRYLKITTNMTNPDYCHIVYLDNGFGALRQNEIRRQAGPAVLIISDLKDALEQGDNIQFFTRNLKLRIAINPHIANKPKFQINSKLLSLYSELN